jgi:hypothetical protein
VKPGKSKNDGRAVLVFRAVFIRKLLVSEKNDKPGNARIFKDTPFFYYCLGGSAIPLAVPRMS